MTKPFTYLIGWSHLRVWYYGAKYAEGCNPNDLWTTYFTSSERVKSFRKEHGEPDVILVRKVFENADSAVAWEHKVLRRLNASGRNDFLNSQNGSGFRACTQDDFMKSKKSQKMKEYWTDERKLSKSQTMKRHYIDNGTESISNGLKKRYSNDEYRNKFSEKMSIVNANDEKRSQAGKTISNKWQQDTIFREKIIESRKGIVWWNNGIETVKSKERPGPEWNRGRANKNLGRKKNETHKN